MTISGVIRIGEVTLTTGKDILDRYDYARAVKMQIGDEGPIVIMPLSEATTLARALLMFADDATNTDLCRAIGGVTCATAEVQRQIRNPNYR